MKNISVTFSIHLKISGEIKHEHNGYSTVLRKMNSSSLVQGSKDCNFDKNFGTKIQSSTDFWLFLEDLNLKSFAAIKTLNSNIMKLNILENVGN